MGSDVLDERGRPWTLSFVNLQTDPLPKLQLKVPVAELTRVPKMRVVRYRMTAPEHTPTAIAVSGYRVHTESFPRFRPPAYRTVCLLPRTGAPESSARAHRSPPCCHEAAAARFRSRQGCLSRSALAGSYSLHKRYHHSRKFFHQLREWPHGFHTGSRQLSSGNTSVTLRVSRR